MNLLVSGWVSRARNLAHFALFVFIDGNRTGEYKRNIFARSCISLGSCAGTRMSGPVFF